MVCHYAAHKGLIRRGLLSVAHSLRHGLTCFPISRGCCPFPVGWVFRTHAFGGPVRAKHALYEVGPEGRQSVAGGEAKRNPREWMSRC